MLWVNFLSVACSLVYSLVYFLLTLSQSLPPFYFSLCYQTLILHKQRLLLLSVSGGIEMRHSRMFIKSHPLDSHHGKSIIKKSTVHSIGQHSQDHLGNRERQFLLLWVTLFNRHTVHTHKLIPDLPNPVFINVTMGVKVSLYCFSSISHSCQRSTTLYWYALPQTHPWSWISAV